MNDKTTGFFAPLLLALMVLGDAAISGLAQAAAPADPTARYHACLDRVKQDPAAALSEAKTWIGQGGGDAAKLCAAAADLALDRPKDAAEAFELLSVGANAPENRAAFLAQAADAWVQAGSPDRAVAVLTEALEIRPGDPQLLIERARAAVDLGRFDEAVEDLTRAIDADSLRVEAYILRASALRRAGRLDEAAVNVDMAMMFDRNNPEALLERGLLRRAAGDNSGAREDWQRVVKIAPGSAAAMLAQRHLGDGTGG